MIRRHFYFISSANLDLAETINNTIKQFGIPEVFSKEDVAEIRYNNLLNVAGHSFLVFQVDQEVLPAESVLWELLPYDPNSIDSEVFFTLKDVLATQGINGPFKYSEVVGLYPDLVGLIPTHQIAGDPPIEEQIDWESDNEIS
jgi:hypothetical protein